MDLRKYFRELKRRKVFKAAIAYLAVAWVLVQVASEILPVFEISPILLKALIILLALGFPINLIFSWIYDVTPEGLQRTGEMEHPGDHSQIKSRRLNRVIIGFLSIAVIFLIYNQFTSKPAKEWNNDIETSKYDEDSRSVAILPLKNMTGDPQQEYICDGMTDAVISRLAGIHDIDKVVPLTSMLEYKNSTHSIPELGQLLDVNYLLEGGFQLFEEEFQINVRLVNAEKNSLLWSEKFAGKWEIDDIFNIQTKIAESVAATLKAKVTENEFSEVRNNYTNNKTAYLLYLEGLYSLNQFDKEGIEKSKSLFKQAIEQDPDFIEAHIRLADAWMVSGAVWGIVDEKSGWSNAKKILNKAASINDLSHHEKKTITNMLNRGLYYYEWDFLPAKNSFDTYFSKIEHNDEEINSEDIPMIAENYARLHGKFLEALMLYHAISADGSANAGVLIEAQIRFFMGEFDRTIEILKICDINYSDNWWYLMESAQLYYHLGMYQNFDNNLKLLNENYSDLPPRILFLNALSSNINGLKDEEIKYLEMLTQSYSKSSSGSPAWFMALYYAHLKNKEECFNWLQKSFEDYENEMIWLRSEPLLKFIHCDPRYNDLYSRVGFLTEPPCIIQR